MSTGLVDLLAISPEDSSVAKVVIDPPFPVLHELFIEFLRKGSNEGIAFLPKAGMGVADCRRRPRNSRLQLNGQFARRDIRGDFDHLHQAIVRFVLVDVPDCAGRPRFRKKDTVGFRNTRLTVDDQWIPIFKPIRLAHRAQ